MSAVAMSILLIVGWGLFAYSACKRWRLMKVARRPECRSDRMGERFSATVKYAFGQLRMVRYPLAGWAHIAVFFGFIVLLLNSLILWGRGYSPGFDFWFLGSDQPLGKLYFFFRDVFTVLVIVGALAFAYNRGIARLKRLTLNFEGALILAIILVMMVADLVYEGGEMVREARAAGESAPSFHAFAPFGSMFASALAGTSDGVLNTLWAAGFWAHSILVLLFLNLLPYGKHFHVITVLPNVFTMNLDGIGRIPTIDDIEGRLEREETLGVKTVEDLSWKDVLDLYTCTECGRCTDQCPASNTGKKLSPKHLSIGIRDHLYENQAYLLNLPAKAGGNDDGTEAGEGRGAATTSLKEDERFQLVGPTIDPEVIWACTTCGACEQECPVFISYIDKIVDLRRHMVMEQGEFPEQLQTAFRGLETVGNPYSYPNEQRAEWAEGLDVPIMAEKGSAEYLFWVGCSASFDDRSRKIARAFSQLLIKAGVDFAILGPEETCNGDPARRAGNEYLFQMFAQQNVEVLNGYSVKKILTICPHCYNIFRNEYPQFDGNYNVIHHADFLAELIRAGKIKPEQRVEGTFVYHDSCYLGRYNDIYDSPREILRSIPGLNVVEAAETRDRGMCCGAGGAQVWKEEEEGSARVNHTRAEQLLRVLPSNGSPRTIASACPFCKTMLSDALGDKGHDDVGEQDIAEILLRSVVSEAT